MITCIKKKQYWTLLHLITNLIKPILFLKTSKIDLCLKCRIRNKLQELVSVHHQNKKQLITRWINIWNWTIKYKINELITPGKWLSRLGRVRAVNGINSADSSWDRFPAWPSPFYTHVNTTTGRIWTTIKLKGIRK